MFSASRLGVMKALTPRRLTLLWLLTLLVITACIYVAAQAFRSVEDLTLPPTENLTRARQAYREIAEHIPIAVHQLNVLLRVHVDNGSRSELERHTQRCAELKQWLETRRANWPRSTLIFRQPANINLTIDVGSMLDDLIMVFDSYTDAVAAMTRTNRAPQASRANTLALRLLEIAGQAQGRAEAIEVFLSFARNWSPAYRTAIFVTIGVLIMFVIWLGFLTYRLGIAPLRQKLVESTVTIEQQKKLAHFGELAAGLAHEIRNPLTAINARLYTLQRSIPPRSPEAEDAAVINSEITRLDRTVKDFLKLARPTDPLFAPLTAQTLFQEVRDLLAGELANHAITLTIGTTAPDTFPADRQQLKQVLINLVQNAADAIGQTGTITLSARCADHHLNGQRQPVIILEVTDTGPGIPAEVQDRLFDPFFSTKEHGTGLGLPISARIVAKHAGILELHSRLGQGAKFSIILPLQGDPDAR
ncbi:MAG: Adaptive-response sensory-kinase SasA [Verrucomicrobiae bacterium]|nr:Adaptive-response sensory-kinase SasA [Verrucomicrobiae bacterium]